MASIAELRQKVVDKAQSDPDFRKLLVSNPREAVQKALGVQLPSGIEIQVMQETQNRVYLVLPPDPPRGQLSDDQLESVSGGTDPVLMFV